MQEIIPPVLGDELRLEQVLQNLIQNGIKYSPEGGTISVEFTRQGSLARLRVSDQGVGIPREAFPHLFERFYRVPNAESVYTGGLGIGLYVVKTVVELHGGAVSVDSTVGVGSTFTVTLPALEETR